MRCWCQHQKARAFREDKVAERPALAKFLPLLQGGASVEISEMPVSARGCSPAFAGPFPVQSSAIDCPVLCGVFLSCAKIDSCRSLGFEGNKVVGTQIMSGEVVGGDRATEQGRGGQGRRRGGRGRGHRDAAAGVAPAQQGWLESEGASESRGQQGQRGSNGGVKQLLRSFQRQFGEDMSSFQQLLAEQMAEERRSREQQQQQICDLLGQQQQQMAEERRSREQQLQRMESHLSRLSLSQNFDPWDSMSQGTNTSGRRQLRSNLLAMYKENPPKCLVSGKTHDPSLHQSQQVVAAHIWPRRHGRRYPKDGGSVDDATNGLFLLHDIETAFDAKKVCFVCNPFQRSIMFKVLDQNLKTTLPSGCEQSYAELDEKQICFADTESRPSFELLSIHAGFAVDEGLKSANDWLDSSEARKLKDAISVVSPEKVAME